MRSEVDRLLWHLKSAERIGVKAGLFAPHMRYYW